MATQRAAVRQSQMNARRAVVTLGGTVLDSMDTVVNALIVNIPDAQAVRLAGIPGVARVHTVRKIRALLDHALPLHKVPDAWASLPLGRDGAGAGIKIAMVDTGIDVKNQGFRDTLPALDGFPKVLTESDLKFTNAKVIVAKNYTPLLPDGGDVDADDRDGHGTGTSMAAAGAPAASPYGQLTGVAPKAYLGNYKVLDANGGTSDVIAKAVDDAVADGMDVINLSLGGIVMSYSDVDGSGIDSIALEAATKAGVIVVVAAGNEGPGASTISDYGSLPNVIAAGAMHNDRSQAFAVRFGEATYTGFSGTGPVPTRAISGTLFDVAQVDATGLACTPLPAGSATGMVVLILRGFCLFETKINNAAAAGAVGVVLYNNVSGSAFVFGAGAATLPAMMINQMDGTDLKSRLAAAPGGAATLDFSAAVPGRTDLTTFSSRGPTVASAMKPDLIAVGDEIITAAQNSFPDGESYSGSGFIDTAGTSFSSPLVAGAAALLKAARPGLTFEHYRSLLINSSTPATVSDGVAATVQQAGAGVLNVSAALSGTVAAYPTALNFGAGASEIHKTLNLKLSNLGTASDTYLVTAAPAKGPMPVVSTNTIAIDGHGSGQLSLTLDATDLAPGEYQGSVRVTGTVNSNVAAIPYWFAVPGTTAAAISVLYQDSSVAAQSSARGAVLFRVVDVAGLPYAGSTTPTVTMRAGGGSVRRTYRAGSVPGTFAVDLRTGSTTMQLDIVVDDVTASVVIGVN
jgi:subtilisin family serine protease